MTWEDEYEEWLVKQTELWDEKWNKACNNYEIDTYSSRQYSYEDALEKFREFRGRINHE